MTLQRSRAFLFGPPGYPGKGYPFTYPLEAISGVVHAEFDVQLDSLSFLDLQYLRYEHGDQRIETLDTRTMAGYPASHPVQCSAIAVGYAPMDSHASLRRMLRFGVDLIGFFHLDACPLQSTLTIYNPAHRAASRRLEQSPMLSYLSSFSDTLVGSAFAAFPSDPFMTLTLNLRDSLRAALAHYPTAPFDPSGPTPSDAAGGELPCVAYVMVFFCGRHVVSLSRGASPPLSAAAQLAVHAALHAHTTPLPDSPTPMPCAAQTLPAALRFWPTPAHPPATLLLTALSDVDPSLGGFHCAAVCFPACDGGAEVDVSAAEGLSAAVAASVHGNVEMVRCSVSQSGLLSYYAAQNPGLLFFCVAERWGSFPLASRGGFPFRSLIPTDGAATAEADDCCAGASVSSSLFLDDPSGGDGWDGEPRAAQDAAARLAQSRALRLLVREVSARGADLRALGIVHAMWPVAPGLVAYMRVWAERDELAPCPRPFAMPALPIAAAEAAPTSELGRAVEMVAEEGAHALADRLPPRCRVFEFTALWVAAVPFDGMARASIAIACDFLQHRRERRSRA